MPPVTRGTRAKKTIVSEGAARPLLKIKLTPRQVRAAIQLSAAEEGEAAAIEKAAAIEAELRQTREAELQSALTVAPRRMSTTDTPPLPASDTGDQSHGYTNVVGEEEGMSGEQIPLVYQ